MMFVRSTLASLGLCVLTLSTSQAASISVYIGQPGGVTSPVAGSTTETFNSLGTGNHTSPFLSAIGTYALDASHPFNIHSADLFGGAGTGGSRYMTFGAQSGTSAPITLNLPSPQDYFGFWWSAGDGNNGLSFYLAGVLLTRYSTSDIMGLLTPTSGTVTAVNGSVYNNSSY